MDAVLNVIALVVAAGFLAGMARDRYRRQRCAVPVIADPHATDGGASACLAMVFAYHGQPESLETLRRALLEPDGTTTALAIVRAAEARGFHAKGLKLDDPAQLVSCRGRASSTCTRTASWSSLASAVSGLTSTFPAWAASPDRSVDCGKCSAASR